MSYLSTCHLCRITAPTDQFDQHHVSRRSRHTIDKKIPLCRTCHMWVEAHPKEAQEMGLIDYSPRYQTEREYHDEKRTNQFKSDATGDGEQDR